MIKNQRTSSDSLLISMERRLREIEAVFFSRDLTAVRNRRVARENFAC
jgi:hypothetical protein